MQKMMTHLVRYNRDFVGISLPTEMDR